MVPVSDIDRAKAFYSERLGFSVDHDTRVSDDVRGVQLTPPGSGCSIVVGKGVAYMPPGSIQGLQLVVSDIQAAHAHLVAKGVEVGEIQVLDGDLDRLSRGGGPSTTSVLSSSAIRTATAGHCSRYLPAPRPTRFKIPDESTAISSSPHRHLVPCQSSSSKESRFDARLHHPADITHRSTPTSKGTKR